LKPETAAATKKPISAAMDKGGSTQRIDKWLWHARFARTRTLATRLVMSGRVRLDRARVTRASAAVRPGNVLTMVIGGKVHVVRIIALAERRGPAVDARTLYEVVEAPVQRPGTTAQTPTQSMPSGTAESGPKRPRGAGRPTKRDRRALKTLMNRDFS
jgi:ribosome-associated heat shock protein Hsp15